MVAISHCCCRRTHKKICSMAQEQKCRFLEKNSIVLGRPTEKPNNRTIPLCKWGVYSLLFPQHGSMWKQKSLDG